MANVFYLLLSIIILVVGYVAGALIGYLITGLVAVLSVIALFFLVTWFVYQVIKEILS